MTKTVKLLVVLGLTAAVGWMVYWRLIASEPSSRRERRSAAVAVEATPVRKVTIRDIGDFSGSLLPKSRFIVAPKVGGRLKSLLVDAGDRVKRGQVIATIDDEEFVQQVEEARAELDVAKANVEQCASDLVVAERDFTRIDILYKKKIASESELDAARARYSACQARQKVAKAQVEKMTAALKADQIRLSYATVRAQWEKGDVLRIVGTRFVDEGALLKPNEPIVSVIEDHVLTGVIHVIERDYPKVKVGQQVTMEVDAHPGRTFTGRIVRVAPLLKESSRQGRVEVEVPNPERVLKTGYFLRARIEFARLEGVTAVPIESLVKREGREGVFLVDEGAQKARFVAVTVGVRSGDLAQVLKPQLDGLVVTLGQHLLEDGTAIRLATGEARGKPPATSPRRPAAPRPGGSR